MQRISIPNSALEASRLAYGCMSIGGSWDQEQIGTETRQSALKVLHAALDQGINFFDHADIYCQGKSEAVFSDLLAETPSLRSGIIIQSKCGIRFPGDPDPAAPARYDFSFNHIIHSVNGSLQRLHTDYLDLLLLHRPDPLVVPEEVARAFDDLQRTGKVRYFGVSNHTAAQIELLQAALDQRLVVNQVEMNVIHTHLLDAGIVFNQDQPSNPVRNEGTLEYCRQHNILLQAWSPLAQGWVTGRTGEVASERIARASEVVAELAHQKGVNGEAILIAWLLKHPAGIQPVVGTTNPARLQAACLGENIELSREEWYILFIAGRGEPLP